MSGAESPIAEAIAARYRIEREIGRGAMGAVYQAEDLKHGRHVAIKVMHAATGDAIGAERFAREIEVVARLAHPHIVPLHDSGEAAGHLYYVMPYVAGESLRFRLLRESPLPLEEALRLTREIAGALGHAHRHGVVHRDVKPENVLLADGIALVADFGIALTAEGGAGASPTPLDGPYLDATLTADGYAVGTPRYMAPEQISGAGVDARSDLYALACVLYEMLAGTPPFAAQAVADVLAQHTTETAADVRVHRPDVPEGIALVLARALAKDPAERYESAARFAEALALARSSAEAPPPVAAPPAAPGTGAWPRPRTTFIGRERERQACAELLRGTRLLTLTGIGGSGKTRLALRLAEEAGAAYPDGVWFVDLAPLKEADRLPLVVAAAAGARVVAQDEAVAALVGHIGSRRALLVLDNCEHLLEATIRLVEAVLGGAPNLTILATSREGLGAQGEQVVALRSLSVPPPDVHDPEEIAAADAVRLFVDRARLIDARFALDPATAGAVAEICRRLDGIPLALELAAARLRVLSVEEIRVRLDDRFRLLAGGGRASLARHQTLRSVIAWSHDSLSEADRRLLEALSMFAGGWTLEAAVRVTADAADEFEVLDGLSRLVDKSLVLTEEVEDGTTRYAMLETVRQFAQERLEESGGGDEVRTRHMRYFARLAERASTRLHGPEQKAWRARVGREQENLLTAHAWCDHSAEGGVAGLALAYGPANAWSARGLAPLGYQVAVEALARPGARVRTKPRLLALHAAAQLASFLGRFDESAAHAGESLALARELGDRERVSQALRLLGLLAAEQGDTATARGHLEESLAIAREIGHAGRLAHALNALGELERAQGHWDTAWALYREAGDIHRARGDRLGMAGELVNGAATALGSGDDARAITCLGECLAIAIEHAAYRVGHVAVHMAAALAARRGEDERAARWSGGAEAQQARMGFRLEHADALVIAPPLERARATLGADAFARAEAAGAVLTLDALMTEARDWLAAL